MVRVIGTINSGNGAKVRLEVEGKVSPRPLFRPFLKDLMASQKQEQRDRVTSSIVGGGYRQSWIENIPPILDGRKRVYQQILCPYYYIVRRLHILQ